MAAATRIISLNLGSQSIELAAFHARPHDGLTLSGYHFREVLVDPTGEGMQRTQIVAALREMLDELQIKSGNVNYAIAEQSVFARFVKLPAVGEDRKNHFVRSTAECSVSDR
jgi:Tfp pilus assembly PilM family ATPase